jgi:hypothetical protein
VVTVNGSVFSVSVSTTNAAQFFRLRKPWHVGDLGFPTGNLHRLRELKNWLDDLVGDQFGQRVGNAQTQPATGAKWAAASLSSTNPVRSKKSPPRKPTHAGQFLSAPRRVRRAGKVFSPTTPSSAAICALMVGWEMCSFSAALRKPPSLATTQK